MGSPLKTFVALVMVLAMIAFVCTDVTYAEGAEPPPSPSSEKITFQEGKAEYPEPTPPAPSPQMNRPKAILPEDPIALDLGNEPEDDSKRKSGNKNPKNTPTTAKREFHRKIMYR